MTDQRTETLEKKSRADIAQLILEIDTLGSERLLLQANLRRQEKRTTRAERTTEILSHCAELMNSSLGLSDVLSRVLHIAVEFMQAERGFIALRHVGQPLEVRVFHNLEREEYETDQLISQSIVERVLHTGNQVVTTDAQADPRFNAELSIIIQQIRSIICVPLRVRATTIGVIYLDSRVLPNLFGMSDPELLMSFANLAGPAIENARLFSEERAHVNEIITLEALQSRILETVAGGIITIDQSNCILAMNECAQRMLGLELQGLLGSSLARLEDPLPGLGELITHSRLTKTSPKHTVNTRDSEGGLRVFEMSVAAVDHDTTVIVVNDLSNQHRVESALSRYLAPHVVRSLLRDPSEIRLGGERQRATILFADIRGFTERSARMRPEDVVELLNRYLERAVSTVFAHNGLLDKFHGDGIMAVFGPPRPCDDDAQRAIQTAIALLAATDQLSQELQGPLRISIGIASGTVVAGHIGSPQRMDYTVIGDAVNLASRLEAKAEPGTFLCDEPTYAAAGLQLPVDSFAASIRGREESFQIYRFRPDLV